MRMKQRILRLTLRLPCFSASVDYQATDVTTEEKVSDGIVIDGNAQETDLQTPSQIGSERAVPIEQQSPKKQVK